MNKQTKNILIGCTGSVATIKIPQIVQAFLNIQTDFNVNFAIRIILTSRAEHFLTVDGELPASVQVYRDQDEWDMWTKRGDAVLHIDLAKWADVMVIAPLDANSLAKMSQGICDNLLLCTVRAWDVARPLFFCPAMNTRMWKHPITAPQIEILKNWGYREIPCISKPLMCGDTGLGGMALPDDIVTNVIHCLEL